MVGLNNPPDQSALALGADVTEVEAILAGAVGIPSFPNAAAPANDVSLAEVLRSVWAALQGTAAGENGITTWPAAAAPGDTVSLAEALRYIVESQIGTLANAGGTATLGGIIGDVANSSLAARFGIVQNHLGPSANSGRYLAVTADFTSATWNDFATTPKHEVFTVTGPCRLRMWVTCAGDVDSAAHGATLQFGHESDTDAFILATDETELDSGDLWYDATPTLGCDTFGTAVLDYVSNGLDVGYEIAGEALSAGSLVFHCVWEPLAAGATVAAGDGGTL